MLQLKLKGSTKHELRKSDNFDFKPLTYSGFDDFIFQVLGRQTAGKRALYIKDPIYPVTSREIEFDYFIDSETLEEFLDTFGLRICNRVRRGIVLTPFELYRVLDSYRYHYINNSVLMHCITPDGVITHAVLDESTPVQSFLKSLYGDHDFYLPLLKKELSEHITAGEITSHLISDRRWSLDKETGVLLPFPKFNRPISLEFKQYEEDKEVSCINCRRCMDYCPESIFPAFYYHYIEREMEEEVAALSIKDCTLCGLCNFICPSNLKLTDRIEQFLISEEVES